MAHILINMKNASPLQTIFYAMVKAIKSDRKFATKQLPEIVEGPAVEHLLILSVIENSSNIAQHETTTTLFKGMPRSLS